LHCDVRHLCADYWTPSGRRVFAAACDSDFDDIELRVQERVGEYTWACKCSVATHVPIGSKILLRMENESSTFVGVFEAGAALRVVGALVSRNEEEATTIASLVGSSEIFVPVRWTQETYCDGSDNWERCLAARGGSLVLKGCDFRGCGKTRFSM